MSAPVVVRLGADPRNVRSARRVVTDALLAAGAAELVDSVTLAVSEVVTNALVHAGGEIELRVEVSEDAVRVEVEDRGAHLPAVRHYSGTASTGRGLQMLTDSVSRWGARELTDGKVVWFEVFRSGAAVPHLPVDDEVRRARPQTVMVTLLNVPLLMHAAWQEHGATLLREHLLHAIADDEDALGQHAKASAAMALLNEQLPAPVLDDDPEALMADAIGDRVTLDRLVLEVPADAVGQFDVLDDLLGRAIVEAGAGRFLSPPTQPEIDEMRQWLCREVTGQGRRSTVPTPWRAHSDVHHPLGAGDFARHADLLAAMSLERAVLATDEASIIVAVSPRALEILAYDTADQLLGRRIIAVVPERFRQAHIAGTTLNATNGRDVLLGVPITVPMLRSDGSEVLVDVEVRPEVHDPHARVFVARFETA